jgi:uncharacterized protein YdaU (DUF1376 family)
VNKALRTTVKAFLKKKGIERDNQRKKEEAAKAAEEAAAAATPEKLEQSVPATKAKDEASAQDGQDPDTSKASGQATTSEGQEATENVLNTSTEAQMDIPQPSIEVS